jgi:hypothetical protein
MQAGDAKYTRLQTLAHHNFVTKWDEIKKTLGTQINDEP